MEFRMWVELFIVRLIWVLLACGIISKGYSQNLEQTKALANKQFYSGDYFEAIATYQRILFFDQAGRAENYHQLAQCYYNTSQYEKAATNYSLAYYSEKNDSIKAELIFKTTQCFLIRHDYLGAQAELLNLSEHISPFFDKKKKFYMGIVFWGLQDYIQSERFFLDCLGDEQTAASTGIKQEFLLLKKNAINPKTARVLSMIIPGAGQFYCGDYKNAFNSFVINLAMLGLYLYVIQAYSFFDALLSVFPWFQRYYTGGIKKSGIIAVNKQNEKRNRAYQNILGIIEASK